MLGWGKKMRAAPLPRKGYGKDTNEVELVSAENITLLGDAFQQRGLTPEQQRNFIRRQLGGREVVRTNADFHRVFSGIRAINRREREANKIVV